MDRLINRNMVNSCRKKLTFTFNSHGLNPYIMNNYILLSETEVSAEELY